MALCPLVPKVGPLDAVGPPRRCGRESVLVVEECSEGRNVSAAHDVVNAREAWMTFIQRRQVAPFSAAPGPEQGLTDRRVVGE
jgi:hypothetical protein